VVGKIRPKKSPTVLDFQTNKKKNWYDSSNTINLPYWKPKPIKQFADLFETSGKEYLQDMLDLRTGDRIGGGATPTSWRLDLFKKRLEEVQQEPFAVKDLKINGQDVMKELDIKPGPKIARSLTRSSRKWKIKN